MKTYRVKVTRTYYIDVDAESDDEALETAESMSDDASPDMIDTEFVVVNDE